MPTEFDFLDRIRSRYSLESIGDDCAVVPLDAEFDGLITADMLVEDMDFRLRWAEPASLGHKALAVSLSDIAAMGGKPEWAMLSIGVPAKLWRTDFLDEFYRGWMELARRYGVELVGGDISRSPDRLVFDSTVFGRVLKGKAVLRSTARPGDLIYVSGTLGAGAGGLAILEDAEISVITSVLVEKQLKPEPEVVLGNYLCANDLATAMIDISDGLSSDLFHICEASQTGAYLFKERLPVHPELTDVFGGVTALEMSLNGGEDYGLLFTTTPEKAAKLKDLDVTLIGEVTPKKGEILLRDPAGDERPLGRSGFSHF